MPQTLVSTYTVGGSGAVSSCIGGPSGIGAFNPHTQTHSRSAACGRDRRALAARLPVDCRGRPPPRGGQFGLSEKLAASPALARLAAGRTRVASNVRRDHWRFL